jgi:hypothetical protein
MDKNKKKLVVFNSPDKTKVRVFEVIPDKATDKTIEIDMRSIRFYVKNNDVENYQRVANQLLFAVVTTGDKCLREMLKDFERTIYEKERSKQS